MKRITALFAVLLVIFVLIPSIGSAQTEKEGIAIFKKAQELKNKARSKEDGEKALAEYARALAIFQRVNSKWEGVTLNCIGLVYLDNLRQYQKALQYFEKSLVILRKTRDKKGQGVILRSMGNVHQKLHQDQRALAKFEEAVEIFKNVKDDLQTGMTLKSMGVVCRFKQRNKALENYKKALEIFKKLKRRDLEAETLYGMGFVHLDDDQAREYFEKALLIQRQIGDLKGQVFTLLGLGGCYFRIGQYRRGLEYYDQCVEVYRKLGDPGGEIYALRQAGNVSINGGLYHKAMEYYGKALVTYRLSGANAYGGAAEPAILWDIGFIYKKLGHYQKALEQYEKASQVLSQDIGKKTCRSCEGIKQKILNDIGITYQRLGRYDEALAVFQKALEIRLDSRVIKESMGNLYLDRGELDKAEPYLREASKLFERGTSGIKGRVLARYHLLTGNFTEAKAYYEALLKQSEERSRGRMPVADHPIIAYTGLATVCEGLEDYKKAEEYYGKAMKLSEEMRWGLLPSERTHFFEGKVGNFLKVAPYDGLARVLMKLNKPLDALEESEYTKARVFAEALSKQAEGFVPNIPKEVMDIDSRLNHQLASLTKKFRDAYGKGDKEAAAYLEPQVKQAKEKLAIHIDMLRKQYPLFAATKYPQPMNLEQAALRDNEWGLAYHVTDPGIIIYLTKGKNLVKALFKAIPRKDVDELVRKFREPMEIGIEDSPAQKLGKFDFVSGKKLSDILLADILSDLPKDTPVIIIPDGSLGVVPFEMLVLNDGGRIATDKKIPYITSAEFFGDRNPISYYQSVTALTLARTLGKQKKPGDRTLAMVDPVFAVDDTRFAKAATEKRRAALDKLTGEKLMSFRTELKLEIPRLPLTGKLGESLKKADPAKTDLYEGIKAQKAALLKSDLTSYRSVVFGTHGYFGKNLPGIQEPVLILTLPGQPEGRDGFLRMTEVMGLKLNADIVALTACQSGLGRVISGEGTMGMGRAFQYAGAKSVLMSLWSVAESSSVDLVTSFFKHLREGKNKLEALKLARDEIRKAGYDHPFFWAPFILVGEVD